MQKNSGDVRISFLPNVNGDQDNLINKLVLAALNEMPTDKAIVYVKGLLQQTDDKYDVPVSIYN